MNEIGTCERALFSRFEGELSASTLTQESFACLAGGTAHDSWRFEPFPIVFERAKGAQKWDISGRRYTDLWMGHGALMFGNAHPLIVESVSRQMQLGQHVGGAHVMQYAWAERIHRNMPSCERIRFTASGTEATLLAMRIARAWTQCRRVLRVDGHFHGWHDEALAHAFSAERSGFNPGTADYVTIVPPSNIESILEEIAEGDVAAIILEPGGGSAGSLPWSATFLRTLRKVADSFSVVLIFDEVISGFRYSVGGVQALADVRPDLTILAKIAAGGMPGGIVAGGSEIMSVFDGGPSLRGRSVDVPHTGTFNAFSLSAAAAIETIDLIGDGTAVRKAEQSAARLVEGINASAIALDVDIRAFHQSSIFHLMVGTVAAGLTAAASEVAVRQSKVKVLEHKLLRAALLLEGVDCHLSHGWVSAVHDEQDINEAIDGFNRAFKTLRAMARFRVQATDAGLYTIGTTK